MIEKDIQEAIEKNLPAVTAGALKKRLDLVDNLEASLKIEVNLKEQTQKKLQEKISQNVASSIELTRLIKELDQFKLREVSFKIAEDNIRSAHESRKVAEAKLEGAMEVTRLVFANTMIRESIHRTRPQILNNTSGPGGNSYQDTRQVTETEDKIISGG